VTNRRLEGYRASETMTKQVYPAQFESTPELLSVICDSRDRVVAISGRPLRTSAAQLVIENQLEPGPGQIGQRCQVIVA